MHRTRSILFAATLLVAGAGTLATATLLALGPERVATHTLGGAVRWFARAAAEAPALPVHALAVAPGVAPVFEFVSTASPGGFSYSASTTDERDGFGWAVVDGNDNSCMSDWDLWTDAWSEMRRERAFWFRLNGRIYRTTDAAALAEAERAVAPVRELGRQQGELGAEQGRLGEKQGVLGGKLGAIGGRLASLAVRAGADREIAELRAEIERLQADVQRQMAPLAEKQRGLGARQRELGARQREASAVARRTLRALAERLVREGRVQKMAESV
jgi:hypothetical protein